MGTLLKSRRAGDAHLAWNRPALSGAETLALTSPAFADGAAIPVEFAAKRAGGRELSPPLAWTAVPAGTAELLLVIEDMDAPLRKPFVHCLALIEPTVTVLDPGALGRGALAPGVRTLRSTVGRGYTGPAPIKGHGPHRYVFELFALGAPAVPAGAAAAAAERTPARTVIESASGPVLARGRLTGTVVR